MVVRIDTLSYSKYKRKEQSDAIGCASIARSTWNNVQGSSNMLCASVSRAHRPV